MLSKCALCPVADPGHCLAEIVPPICTMVAAGHPLWPAKLVRTTAAGDPWDFINNPEINGSLVPESAMPHPILLAPGDEGWPPALDLAAPIEVAPGPTLVTSSGPPPVVRDRDGTEYDPALLALIPACPDRGPTVTDPACGCWRPELNVCRRGRGATAGQVTTRECYACLLETRP